MTLNREYYGRIKIHQGIDRSNDKKENSLNEESEAPTLFVARGKPDFNDSNLKGYGWKRINTPNLDQKRFFESTSGYKDYKELIIYEGPQGIAVVNANYKKDKHKIAVYLNNYTGEKLDKLKSIQVMFENEWECKLEEENSDLVNKIKEN